MTGDEVEAAWQANVDAVQSAKAAIRDAMYARARVETQCGRAARRRDPAHPVLNAAEVARIEQSMAAVAEARQRLVEAQIRFKAGVPE